MAGRQVSTIAIALLIVFGIFLMAAPAQAEDASTEREIKAVKRKIQELQHAAERAQEAGHEDKAHELATRARDLTQRLEAFFQARAKANGGNAKKQDRVKRKAKKAGRAKQPMNPEKVIHNLMVAIKSLKALGGQDELIQYLFRTIEQIKRRARDEHAQRRHEEEGHEEERHEKRRHGDAEEDEERAGLRWRVETMRMALPALREGEKAKLAAIIERAIHTGEMLLEGREDEEARKVFARTPSFPELAEVLRVSAKLWRGFGHGEQAQRVHKLARYYAERSEARETEAREEREEETEEVDDPRREGRSGEGRERGRREREEHHEGERRQDERRGDEIKELREHLHHLRKQIEDLARHLEKLSQRK